MAALTIEFPQTVWTVEFGGDEIVVAEVTMTGGTGGGFDGVHNDLDGRSTADAHPISAITGLQAALDAAGGGGGDFQTVGPFDLLEGGGTLTGVPRHVAVSGSEGDLPGPVSVTMPSAPADPDGAWTVSYGAFDDASLDELDVVGALNLSVIPRGYTAVLTPVPGVGWFCDGLFPTATVPTGGGAVDSVNGETGVVVLDAADVGAVDVALVGAPDGVAELDSGGLVPSSQLPSYVDDVIEAANFAALPGTGATGKIYVTLDNNLTFRWSGSAYAEISASLALGETSSTAHRGDHGKTAHDHSQVVTGNPHGTTAGDITSGTFDAARIPDLDAAKITTGTVAQARLGSGSAGAGTKFLADDQTYKTVSSGIADPGGSNDDFLQRKAGAWTHRTVAQVKAEVGDPYGLGAFNPSGKYLSPVGFSSTVQPSAGYARPYVIWLPGGTINGLGVGISSGGSAGFVGHIWMYGVDDYLRLGDLLVDAGSVAADSTAMLRMNGITPTVIPSGRYGFAVVSIGSGTAPMYRGFQPSSAPPAPFNVGNSAIDFANSMPTINAVNSLTATPPSAWAFKNNGSPNNQQGGVAPAVIVRYA